VQEGNLTFRIVEATLWRAGLALGLAVLVSGCQRMYWYQEGKTFDECRSDYEDCQAELLQRTDRRYASSYRHRFIDDCMRARGYEVVAGKDLPLDVAREDPMVPSDWPGDHAYGVAGSVPPEPGVLPPDVARAESAALMSGAPRSAVSPRPPPRQGSASSGP
jgi:hypothetical protein